MNIHYRKLTPEDIKEYRQIRLECLKNYPDNFSSTFEDESKKSKLAFEIYIEEQALEKFMMGAFDDEKLIGICGFFREDKKKTNHIGTIIQMYVQSNYSGKGIGLKLLNATVEEALKIPGIEQLVLGVVTTNSSANRIYEKAGFEEYGIHKNYFKAEDNYADQRFMILYRDGVK